MNRHRRSSVMNRAGKLHLAAPSLVVVATLIAVPRATARDFQWVGGSGSWSDRNNWSPAGVPSSSSDTVTIQTEADMLKAMRARA